MRIVKGSLNRVLEVIELLASEARWMRLSEIARRLGLPDGPTHRLVTYLCDQGWVAQSEDTAQYRLTFKLPLLGQEFLHHCGLRDPIQPLIDDVATECGELVRLTIVQKRELSWLASAQGAKPGLLYEPAMHGPVVLHVTANGKAWLATMTNEVAVEYALAGGLGKPGLYEPRAIATVQDFVAELEKTRKRGYAVAMEEAERGVAAVAVAVRSPQTDDAVGTISIAGPVVRVVPARFKELSELLRRAALRLSVVWPHLAGPNDGMHKKPDRSRSQQPIERSAKKARA